VHMVHTMMSSLLTKEIHIIPQEPLLVTQRIAVGTEEDVTTTTVNIKPNTTPSSMEAMVGNRMVWATMVITSIREVATALAAWVILMEACSKVAAIINQVEVCTLPVVSKTMIIIRARKEVETATTVALIV